MLFIVTLLLLPVSLGESARGTANSAGGELLPADSSVSVNLTLNSTYYDLPSIFWGTTISARAPLLADESALIQSTPANVLMWPGAAAGDDYDPINNTIYATTSGKANPNPPTSEAQFVDFCESINCTAIVQLPGEIDSPSYAAQVVQYTEDSLGFHPAYWEIGNEPGLWKHWQIPWASWATHRKVNPPTPMEYAWEVNNYTSAVHVVDPTARIIGLPGVGKAGPDYSQWINDTVLVNGPNLSAIAVHEYPESATGVVSLSDFYAAINGPTSIAQRAPEIDAWVQAACPTCHIPLFLTEIGSGLSHKSYGSFEAGFPGALDLAAQMTEAMNDRVSNVDLYATVLDTNNSWFALNGSERPDYALYASILGRLGTEVYPANMTSSAQTWPNVTTYAIASVDPTAGNRADLLVVNTNLTETVTFTPQLPGIASTSPTEVWTWENNSTLEPVASFDPAGLPSTFTLPPQSLVLLEAYPSGSPGAPLEFDEVGLNLSAVSENRWFVDVNGALSSSEESNLTLFLPAGTYPTSAPPLPITGSPRERAEPFPPSTVSVGSTPSVHLIPFADQWILTLVVEPVGAGMVTPSPGWANASVPVTLTASAAPGFGFSHWFGWGDGSFNGSSNPAEILPAGPITEKAIFDPTYAVTFAESGLPDGTDWSVVVRGTTYTSSTSVIQFALANGSYGFRIVPPPAFRAHPVAGSFNVSGSSTEVAISFQHETPPGQRYPVTFNEVGLPIGTNWSVTVRGQTNSSSTGSIEFNVTNGTYGFQVGKVSGYRSVPTNSSVTVEGAPVNVSVRFIALTPPGTTYAVTFQEVGLPAATFWSVTVRNDTQSTEGTELVFLEINGSYGFQVSSPVGLRANYDRSGFVVNGSAVDVSITYVARQTSWAVHWTETGLWANVTWWVMLDNDPVYSNGTWTTAVLANGTYAYLIEDSADFVPHARAGLAHVSGAGETIRIVFTRAMFPVAFQASGLPGNAIWTVRLSSVTNASVSELQTFELPNGSYTFDIVAPSGFYPNPSHGNLTVSATPIAISVSFVHDGLPPIKFSAWYLGARALGVAAIAALAGWGSFTLLSVARRRRRSERSP